MIEDRVVRHQWWIGQSEQWLRNVDLVMKVLDARRQAVKTRDA